MSLSKFNKIDRVKGAIFKSHIDGKTFVLSPEESIRIQKKLNSDIVMVMDECPKNTNNYNKIKISMDLSMEWAKRSKEEFGKNSHKALFGIVQGGLFKDLRNESLKKLIDIEFDGYAIGGLAVGETQNEMFDVLDGIKDNLPIDKPRYLMGVGTPSDILGAVKRGIDMFDCVLPTRSGRTGLAFTWNGRIQIRNSENKFISKNDQTGINSTLSAEQIAKRNKELKDGLARTAALAENEVYKTKNNLELKIFALDSANLNLSLSSFLTKYVPLCKSPRFLVVVIAIGSP